MEMLTRLELYGFKSIRDLPELTLGALNVLIGANGAGKSNLLSFFRLLSWMTVSPGNLQEHIGRAGGAASLLYDGDPPTAQIEARLTFQADHGRDEYHLRLDHAAGDTLIFGDERYRYSIGRLQTQGRWKSLGAGHRETKLIAAAEGGDRTARSILELLRQCTVHQFHNTSETARIRQRWQMEDNGYLRDDAANLAPFLLRIREAQPQVYRRIVDTIRQIVPFFADFVLEPVNGSVALQWRERGTDLVFGSHQASDGTLRAMALVSLLLQPLAELPAIIILDEPELGLHPYAITILAGLLQSISLHSQIIIATQSMTLVDYFEPEQIIVVDRPGRESTFRRLDTEKLREWLEEYSLAELWEKNVLGGRPVG